MQVAGSSLEPLDNQPLPPTADEGEDDLGVPSHTGKYRELWRWLRDQDSDEIHVSFEQVERILGLPLPTSARLHPAHWYSYEGSAVTRAIRDAGWKASKLDLPDEHVTFVRPSGVQPFNEA